MDFITAYGVIIEPISGRLPVEESIESLYDEVDQFVILDLSKYDRINLGQYGKVRHLKGLFNPFDNPFGSAYTAALKLVPSEADILLFLDLDELFEFKIGSLRSLIKGYPLDQGAGIAFSLVNYFCSRNYIVDGCSSKGPHVFKNREGLYHDLLRGYWGSHDQLRRTNHQPDGCDGVRLVNGDGVPMPHYPPVSIDQVVIHHTSHLDPVGKLIRSIIQFNHTSTIDLPGFYPYDMRVTPELIQAMYVAGEEDIKKGDFKLYGEAVPREYVPIPLLDRYINRFNIMEFDPSSLVVAA